MKTFRKLTLFFVFLSMGGLFLTCDKDNLKEVESEFEFVINGAKTGSISLLKNSETQNFDQVRKIVLTIKKADGSDTKYNFTEITVYNFNGILYSQRISLGVGNYQLTEFFLVDAYDSILYVTPSESSIAAQNCSTPLPINLNLIANKVQQVNVDVLSFKGKTPEDFGLVRFNVNEVKTFAIRIGVLDSSTDEYIAPKLAVTSQAYSYNINLQAVANNLITLKDGLTNYTLTVEKSNYETFTETYTAEELKNYIETPENSPLLIILNRIPVAETVTDIDGNVYRTVTICGKTWMAENLKTTRYNDGSSIIKDPQRFGIAGLNYNSDVETYGLFYNWFAVNTGKLAPEGWHVPSIDEWRALVNCVNGDGGNLKETGTLHWLTPNTGATNSSGFTGLPAGYFYYIEEDMGYSAYFWTTSIWDSEDPAAELYAWHGLLKYNSIGTYQNGFFMEKDMGFSIRCVKN